MCRSECFLSIIPSKDTTAADLVRLKKSLADNASGLDILEAQSLSVATDVSDLKKVSTKLAASIAMLHQGMQTLLADRSHNKSTQGFPGISSELDARITAISDPVVVAFLSPCHTDFASPRRAATRRQKHLLKCPPKRTFSRSFNKERNRRVQTKCLIQNMPPVLNYKALKVDSLSLMVMVFVAGYKRCIDSSSPIQYRPIKKSYMPPCHFKERLRLGM